MKIKDGSLERYTTIDGQRISFVTSDLAEVDKLFTTPIKKALEAKIAPKKKKRSLDANAYMWHLCDEIAKVGSTTKVDVYCSHIRNVGVFTDVAILKKAVPVFIKNWCSKGDGWLAEIQPDCKINGCLKVRVYYGSSSYDSVDMARLIDKIVEEAKGLGIETLTENELLELNQKWGCKNDE